MSAPPLVQACHVKFHKIRFDHKDKKDRREAFKALGSKMEIRVSLRSNDGEKLDQFVTETCDRSTEIDLKSSSFSLWKGLDKSFVECKRFEIKISLVFFEKKKKNEEKLVTFFIPLAAFELNTTCSYAFVKEGAFGKVTMPMDFQLVDFTPDPGRKPKTLEAGYFDHSWILSESAFANDEDLDAGDIDVTNTVERMYNFASRYNIPEELLINWDFIRSVVQLSMQSEGAVSRSYRSTAPTVSIHSISKSHLLTQTKSNHGMASSEAVGWMSSVPYQISLMEEI